ncbi:MAG: hypothetical protein ACI86M_002644, partial [Saprospiraceae bacterium]
PMSLTNLLEVERKLCEAKPLCTFLISLVLQ